ncbi:MAG: S-layer homology domain-containing protein [Faecousia sp.]
MKKYKALLTLILAVMMVLSLLPVSSAQAERSVPALRTGSTGAVLILTDPPLDAMTSATLTASPANGQQVVVYYDAVRAALSVNAHGNGLDATTATVNNSVSISIKTAEAALLTVETDGTFYRFASDSGYLCGKDGVLLLSGEAADSQWVPERCDDGFYLKNDGRYLCYANGSFTMGSEPSAITFYAVRPHTHDYQAVETAAATCFSDGYVIYRCAICGDTYTKILPLHSNLCPSKTFIDVDRNQWYHKAIDFVVTNGYMQGTGQTTFEPNATMTRAMLVTALYRVAGTPDVTAKPPFTDLRDDWYDNAVAWAYENGIVNGTSSTAFSPEDPVTREQLAAILYRYAEAVPAAQDKLSAFPDSDRVSNYAVEAMNWAVNEGVINGSLENGVLYLRPNGNATRAEIAQMLMNYLDK